MISDNDVVKLIIGFKIRHLRLHKKISYQEMSDATGMSLSYLNDIEKGKKYPKPDKIQALAKVLDLEYDELVSTQTDKKLQPVIDLLNSGFFKYFPLDEFGISLEKLMDVFSNNPDRFGAFISTILKMIRSYQIEKEHFYRIALRSYQDIHDNYFPELEAAAQSFKKDHQLKKSIQPSFDQLEDVLRDQYHVTVDRHSLATNANLIQIRSYYQPEKKVLYLNKDLNDGQELFILAREIGFHYMNILDRPLETRLKKEASFDKLLGNFKASYFAAALLMDGDELAKDIELMARATEWSPVLISKILKKYQVSPETLLQRFTNILPSHFNLRDLFFIRLESTEDMIRYNITKELHLSQLHTPYHTELGEHLCHRWVSISAIKNLRSTDNDSYFIDAQISDYWQTNKSYFCITIGQSGGFKKGKANSVSLGLLMSEKLKGTFNFIKDPDVKRKAVNTTCERCSMPDCDNRVAAPVYIEEEKSEKQLEEELKKL